MKYKAKITELSGPQDLEKSIYHISLSTDYQTSNYILSSVRFDRVFMSGPKKGITQVHLYRESVH